MMQADESRGECEREPRPDLLLADRTPRRISTLFFPVLGLRLSLQHAQSLLLVSAASRRIDPCSQVEHDLKDWECIVIGSTVGNEVDVRRVFPTIYGHI